MSFGKVERGFLPLVVCWFNFQIVHSLLINLHILLRYPTPIFYFLMGPQCVHKHYIPPFSGIYVVVIGKKGGKLRRQILQPSQAIDFQSILIYVIRAHARSLNVSKNISIFQNSCSIPLMCLSFTIGHGVTKEFIYKMEYH